MALDVNFFFFLLLFVVATMVGGCDMVAGGAGL